MVTPWLRRIRLPLGFFVLQTIFASYQILSRMALDNGVKFFAFSFYRSVFALALLVPAALIFERRTRPRLTWKLVFKFLMLSFIGLFSSQSLFLAGAESSSSALASALQNSVPVFTFIVASAMGVEQVHIRRLDGVAKVIGTIICMSGVVIMTMFKGALLVGHPSSGLLQDGIVETMPLNVNATTLAQWLNSHASVDWSDWQIGALLCITNAVFWATYLTLQAPIQEEYPAPLTVLAFTYLFGAMQFGGAAIAVEREISVLPLQGGLPLLAVAYAGLISSALAYTLQAWCIRMGGPILTAACTPLQSLVALPLAVIFLGDPLYFGSILGGAGIVMGLYLVTWGRKIAWQTQSMMRSPMAEEEGADLEKSPDFENGYDLEKGTRRAPEAGLTSLLLPVEVRT